MPRSTPDIIADLKSFEPVEDEWLDLDELLEELWTDGAPGDAVEALFGIFERFPTHDGHGVFWSIIHGLEDLSEYQQPLVDSMRRQPSISGIIMVNRLLNGGYTHIEGTPLLSVLKAVADDPTQEHPLREKATRFCQRHTDKAR